jgi:hypothetical protein
LIAKTRYQKIRQNTTNFFLNSCPIKSKDFIDKPNERSILKVNLMNIGRGLKRKEGGNLEEGDVGFAGYGDFEWMFYYKLFTSRSQTSKVRYICYP